MKPNRIARYLNLTTGFHITRIILQKLAEYYIILYYNHESYNKPLSKNLWPTLETKSFALV